MLDLFDEVEGDCNRGASSISIETWREQVRESKLVSQILLGDRSTDEEEEQLRLQH